MWWRYINLLFFIMYFFGRHPVSRYSASMGVLDGAPSMLLRRYSSTELSFCMCSSLILYHNSLLNKIPFNSIVSLNSNPTVTLKGPSGISSKMETISFTIPYHLSVLSFMVSSIDPSAAMMSPIFFTFWTVVVGGMWGIKFGGRVVVGGWGW